MMKLSPRHFIIFLQEKLILPMASHPTTSIRHDSVKGPNVGDMPVSSYMYVASLYQLKQTKYFQL